MTSPAALTSGPPELPGLIAASVWIALMNAWSSGLRSPAETGRLSALTMPVVTVPASPSGAPIGDDGVADDDRVGVAEQQRGQALDVDLEHREVVVGGAADDRAGLLAAVGEHHVMVVAPRRRPARRRGCWSRGSRPRAARSPSRWRCPRRRRPRSTRRSAAPRRRSPRPTPARARSVFEPAAARGSPASARWSSSPSRRADDAADRARQRARARAAGPATRPRACGGACGAGRRCAARRRRRAGSCGRRRRVRHACPRLRAGLRAARPDGCGGAKGEAGAARHGIEPCGRTVRSRAADRRGGVRRRGSGTAAPSAAGPDGDRPASGAACGVPTATRTGSCGVSPAGTGTGCASSGVVMAVRALLSPWPSRA